MNSMFKFTPEDFYDCITSNPQAYMSEAVTTFSKTIADKANAKLKKWLDKSAFTVNLYIDKEGKILHCKLGDPHRRSNYVGKIVCIEEIKDEE